MDTEKTFCYFGIYEPTFARDLVLLKGLEKNGVRIISCTDSSWFLFKFVQLFIKHWQLRHDYDVLFVGYLSNMMVPFARLISRKRVVYNALNAMYEGSVLDRQKYGVFSPRRYIIWFIDFFAFHAAHLVLVETDEQKKFIAKKFHVPTRKLTVIFTGADDEVFHPDSNIAKRDGFYALFRGWFLPATGVEYVLEAAKILKDSGVNFLLIGRGPLLNRVKRIIADNDLSNVELVTEFISDEELRKQILSCHVMLGQFANHPRLDRTIQNKNFEALALAMPCITRDSISNRELLTDGLNCLFVRPADADDLAQKILILKDDAKLRENLANNGYQLYIEKLKPKALGKELLSLL